MNPDQVNYEALPPETPKDETDVSLRAYLAALTDEHLANYDPQWDDEQLMQWDGNFRSDGALMLVCCERDVEVDEFRAVLVEHLAYRVKLGGLNWKHAPARSS